MKSDMNIAVYKNASTFSHVGRHASELRFLLNSLDTKPKKVLELGSGCLEPIYFAQLLEEDATLYSVDLNPDLVSILNDLVNNKKIDLSGLSELICNKNEDGSCRVNTDLTNPVLLQTGRNELQLAGLDPEIFFEKELYKMPSGGATIHPICAELSEYCEKNRDTFDFVYAGVVLLNVAKAFSSDQRQEFVNLVKPVVDSIKPKGTLGVSTNPAGYLGDLGVPGVLEDAGATITDFFADHLVKVKIGENYRLFGGHCIRAKKTTDEDSQSYVNQDEVKRRIANDPVLNQLQITYRQTKGNTIGSEISNLENKVLLAATRNEEGYIICTTPKNVQLENVLPEMERKAFGLIPRYK